MQPSDHSIVARMMKALYRYLGLPEEYLSDEKIAATMAQLAARTNHLFLDVFMWEDRVVGYALLFKYWYNEFGGMVLNIDELFIEPDFRSKGIASHYLRHLEQSNSKDYVALSLEVLPENEKAYALYKRAGFTEKETVMLYKII
jgi:ribosomal protein S18 acetylase RimI-like enzyme